MKKHFYVFWFWIFALNACSAAPDVDSHSVQFNQDYAYRVSIRFPEVSDKYELGKCAFNIPSPGLAPFGASIEIFDQSDQMLSIGAFEAYSSAMMWSELITEECGKVETTETNAYVSDWFKLEDLIFGIDRVIGGDYVLDSTMSYRVVFRFALNGVVYVSESEKIQFDQQMIAWAQ